VGVAPHAVARCARWFPRAQGYLRHERDLILSTAVEESRRETLRAYEAAVTAAAQAEWEQTKRRIFEELGHAAAGVEMLPEPALGAAADASFSSSRFGDLTYDPNASMLATSMLNVSQASSFAGVRRGAPRRAR